MATKPSFPSVTRAHGVTGFASATWGTLTWRAAIATQSLGALFALTDWLERDSAATLRLLAYLLCAQAMTALLVMLAALTGDEAVRRGWKVLRAFVIVVLCASVLNAAAQWVLDAGFGDIVLGRAPVVIANDFFNVGALWGTALMVYLNRQSAARLLARLRADELERAEAEGRMITSRLAAVEARMDPASVLRQLSEVRDQFAAGRSCADGRLEELIAALRESVMRSVSADGAVAGPQEARS